MDTPNLNTSPANDLRSQYESMVSQWERDTQFDSTMSLMLEHPVLDKIIKDIPRTLLVSFVCDDLKREVSHRFIILQTLVGSQIKLEASEMGKIPIICQKWIDWAEGWLGGATERYVDQD